MKRQILVFSGLFVLFLLFGFSSNALAANYKVKNGDTLSSISKKFSVSVNEIKKANNLRKSSIKTNQVLKIAQKRSSKSIAVEKNNSSYCIVKRGDTLSRIAQKNHIPLKKLMALNNNLKTIRAGQKIVLAKSTPQPKKQTSLAKNQHEDLEETNEEADADVVADEDTNVEEESDNGENVFSSAYRFISGEEFLGKWRSSNEMQRLVKVATGFLGTPYRLGGNSKRGIDCSSFVQKVYRNFNVNLPRVARDQSEVGVEVDIDKMVKGDLIFFDTNRSFGHVGIYIGNNKFIHASSRSRRVRIDSLDHPFYQERFQRAVRIKELPVGG